MPINLDKKLIHIHIPRTGGTSMEITKIMQTGGHWTALEFKKQLDMGLLPNYKFYDFYRYSFVRNPWDRLVSAYSYFINQEIDFRDFVLNKIDIADKWFMPQYKYIYDENKNSLVNFIGRFENIEIDWKSICDLVGVNEPLGKCREGNHTYYKDYYDDELKKKVEELYREDINLFEYEF